MPDEPLFTVASRSTKSGITRSASHSTAQVRPANRPAPHAGIYGSLSDFATNSYQTVKGTIADGVRYAESTRVGRFAGHVYNETRDHLRAAVSYVGGPFRFERLPASVMQQFGFSPVTTHEECPFLQTPTVQQVGALTSLVKSQGEVFAGVVDLSMYGDGSRHFYIVAAKCGNVNTIARNAGLPPDSVRSRLGSMLGMIATWAGCMMGGGASIEPAPNALPSLESMDAGGSAPQQAVFGKGILTKGRDMVELRNATRVSSGAASLHTFLARTLYYHALSGSVLHMQYIAGNGDLNWFWVGAGGKGFMSRYVNNTVAIQMDIGMWPDMARSITAFYGDRDMVRKFVGATPRSIRNLIKELIHSTEDKKSYFMKLEQEGQVNNPIANDVRESGLKVHPQNGVKGE